MNIPVLVEQLPDHRYRAKCGEPFVVSADGNTDEDAVNNLRRLMQSKLSNGARLASVELPTPEENPWVAGAGCLKDDPLFDEWQEAIKENRRREAEADSEF
jgi:predicted RNase H-like HicB family nuclease